jgi:hypothetical protein
MLAGAKKSGKPKPIFPLLVKRSMSVQNALSAMIASKRSSSVRKLDSHGALDCVAEWTGGKIKRGSKSSIGTFAEAHQKFRSHNLNLAAKEGCAIREPLGNHF